MRSSKIKIVVMGVFVAGSFILLFQILHTNAQTNRAALFAAMQADRQPVIVAEINTPSICTDGMAGIYPCKNVDLLAHLPLPSIGGGSGNDIWGWTDPQTNREYALMGLSTGTAFVDITDPAAPIYLGNLPTHSVSSIWRDIKVYANYAFIVSEAPGHGMQIFDLTLLRTVPTPPATFVETMHYDGINSAHNIAINTDTGFAYVVGANNCGGGLHMVNIQDPLAPEFAGCFSADGYTHDTQCVIYTGPDINYQGHEICFSANEDTLTIVDVSDKANPQQVARETYAGVSYTHQGWLTEDHTTFLLDDEGDEIDYGTNTRTFIWDVTTLTEPTILRRYTADTTAIDHNLYIYNGKIYQANYRAGLRILEGSDFVTSQPVETAYFDTYPDDNAASFDGAWSVYPFFASGTIIVSDINRGLMILKASSQPPQESFKNYLAIVSRP